MKRDLEKDQLQLKSIAKDLLSVKDDQELELAAQRMLQTFRKQSFKNLEKGALESLIHNICARLTQIKEGAPTVASAELFAFLLEKRLVPLIYQDYLAKKLESSTRSHPSPALPSGTAGSGPCEELVVHLEDFFKMIDLTEAGNKNIGIALLDLEGHFLMLCKKSQYFLGIKNTEMKAKSLFDLMIPFSRNFLFDKHGKELFDPTSPINARVFTYVIYSKTAYRDFLSALKAKSGSKGFKLEEKLRAIKESNQNNNTGIYHAYMKALSSYATIVTFRYTDQDIQNLEAEKLIFKQNLSFLRQGDNGMPIDSAPVAPALEVQEEVRDGLEPPAPKPVPMFSYTKRMVLLKTRFSKQIPAFDFSKLNTQPQIIEFEKSIERKLTKIDSPLK